jgi:predicted GIY-YIG superfamily endonuclease
LSLNPQSEDIFAKLGIYKLTCPDCEQAYVGQTGRDFRTRFNEHKRSFIHNKTSKYALHLLEHSHNHGSMHDVQYEVQ